MLITQVAISSTACLKSVGSLQRYSSAQDQGSDMKMRATSQTRSESDDVIGFKQENNCSAGSEVWGRAHTQSCLNAEIQPSLHCSQASLIWPDFSLARLCVTLTRGCGRAGLLLMKGVNTNIEVPHTAAHSLIIHQPGELRRFQFLTLRADPSYVWWLIWNKRNILWENLEVLMSVEFKVSLYIHLNNIVTNSHAQNLERRLIAYFFPNQS